MKTAKYYSETIYHIWNRTELRWAVQCRLELYLSILTHLNTSKEKLSSLVCQHRWNSSAEICGGGQIKMALCI